MGQSQPNVPGQPNGPRHIHQTIFPRLDAQMSEPSRDLGLLALLLAERRVTQVVSPYETAMTFGEDPHFFYRVWDEQEEISRRSVIDLAMDEVPPLMARHTPIAARIQQLRSDVISGRYQMK